MKHKVTELEGALLDAAVAKAEGIELIDDDYPAAWDDDHAIWRGWSACRDWRIGGPIIERERISLTPLERITNERSGWSANFEIEANWEQHHPHVGPTALIAAMRAFCASVFGDEVDLVQGGRGTGAEQR